MSAFASQLEDVERVLRQYNEYKEMYPSVQQGRFPQASSSMQRTKNGFNGNQRANGCRAKRKAYVSSHRSDGALKAAPCQPFVQQYQQIQAATAVLNKLLESQQGQHQVALQQSMQQTPVQPSAHGLAPPASSHILSLASPLPSVPGFQADFTPSPLPSHSSTPIKGFPSALFDVHTPTRTFDSFSDSLQNSLDLSSTFSNQLPSTATLNATPTNPSDPSPSFFLNSPADASPSCWNNDMSVWN